MPETSPSKPLPLWRRVRFSLGGLLIFTFGLAVGLAYGRIEGTTWPDRLLAVFAGWFVVGMGQSSWQALRRWRNAPAGLPRDVRFAMLLEIVWPLVMIGMVATAGSLDILGRDKTAPQPVNDHSSWTLLGLIQATFFLAIICGYYSPASRSWFGEKRWNRWNLLYAVLALVLCHSHKFGLVEGS